MDAVNSIHTISCSNKRSMLLQAYSHMHAFHSDSAISNDKARCGKGPCRAEAVVNGVERGEGPTVAQAICMLVRHLWVKEITDIFITIYWFVMKQ